ncbi:MAG: two pore domain potassium channel family protein [Deltaproteobacteria bacterium]|nr:two pore domain potassium channel family protein [Deltaproteobacteria bacterium]
MTHAHTRAGRHFHSGFRHFIPQVAKVARNPIFAALTAVGNFMLFFGAWLFYTAEYGTNRDVASYGDALWWAFVTITTVGYGDISPQTGLGRAVGVVLVLTAGVLFFSFIALLSSGFVDLEVHHLEEDVAKLNEKVDSLLTEIRSSKS